jgi:hypothetical protein
LKKIKAWVFVHIVLPCLNAFCKEDIIACPCCGELLQHYSENGYLHLADGDADCYGALGYGKGN